MGTEVLKILSVFLLSSVKFGIGGVPAAVFANFSFFKAMLITISGGMTGVVVFTYFSDIIDHKLRKLFPKKKDKKKFTRVNKIIVYAKKYFGLVGISVITPLVLSIPLGVFIAMRFYHHEKNKIIRYMFVSITVWAVVIYYAINNFRNLF